MNNCLVKLSLKLSVAISATLIVIANITGCSKKKSPVPVTKSTSPVQVYDVKNAAPLYPTTGMAIDFAGNLYVSDPNGQIITKYSPSGTQAILAGSGKSGAINGIGIAASFNVPSGLAVDAAGNVFVADAANNLIRKIDSGGNVTTVAGSGVTGSADGIGNAASFNFPQGIAIDRAGNLYIADTGNDLIRKITPDQLVTTLAGRVAAGNNNGPGIEARFNIPQGIAVDAQGNIYVADAGNNLIRKIDPSGIVTTLAGSGFAMAADGDGIQASFNFPNGLAIDSNGILYVTEGGSNAIRQIDLNNYVTALAFRRFPYGGQLNFRGHSGARFPIFPNGLAFDSKGRNLYVADYGNGWLEIY